ncbi:MAG: hypothetical protein JW800_02135 [Candidatus Omnitrophica bacterium]|nr:hypothetical protein [Candidatus Omnitrophota bacterium]
MPDKKITIEFKDGKKIVKNQDGSVKEYTRTDAERHKDFLLRRREDLDRQISRVDEDITNIEKSKKV